MQRAIYMETVGRGGGTRPELDVGRDSIGVLRVACPWVRSRAPPVRDRGTFELAFG